MKSKRSNRCQALAKSYARLSNDYRRVLLEDIENKVKVIVMTVMKLTKQALASLQPKEKEYFAWDTELKGFGVRISPKGQKTYVLRAWVPDANKPQHLSSIGQAHLLELDEARREARLRLRELMLSKDQQPESITFNELSERYLIEQAKAYPRSWKENNRRAINYLLPEFGRRNIDKITRAEIAVFHHRLGQKYPYQANRCKEQIGRMYELAKLWYLLPDSAPNPTNGIKDFPEQKRNRWLRPVEIKRLAKALEPESTVLNCFFKLMIATCTRKQELLSLTWKQISEHGIELGKTKNGAPHFIAMTPFIHGLLQKLKSDSPWVFPNETDPTKQRNTVDKAWQRIRKRAELDDVRIHDLRRTGASLRLQAGESLDVVGKMLNHKCRDTTEGYAYLSDQNVKHAFERHSAMIAQYFSEEPTDASREMSTLQGDN